MIFGKLIWRNHATFFLISRTASHPEPSPHHSEGRGTIRLTRFLSSVAPLPRPAGLVSEVLPDSAVDLIRPIGHHIRSVRSSLHFVPFRSSFAHFMPWFFIIHRGDTDGQNFVALLLVIACLFTRATGSDDPVAFAVNNIARFPLRLRATCGGRGPD